MSVAFRDKLDARSRYSFHIEKRMSLLAGYPLNITSISIRSLISLRVNQVARGKLDRLYLIIKTMYEI